MKKVTIYDIAKEVGFSPSTVSRVLGRSTRKVDPKIEEIIKKKAKEMNYYPNTLARNLKSSQNRTIGVVLPSIANPFYPSIVRGMEDEAIEHGYTINICSCDQEQDRIDSYLERLIEDRVSGLITLYLEKMPKPLEDYISHNGKVITVGTKDQLAKECGVMRFDKSLEAYRATKHLLELGHEHIALFLSDMNNAIRQEKYKGYLKALEEYKKTQESSYLYVYDGKETVLEDLDSIPDCITGKWCAKKLIEDQTKVTGIVCMNDLVALGAMSHLQSEGYKVPEDYAVVGFDDTFFSDLINPSITTLKVDKYKLGKHVIQELLKMIEEDGYLVEEDLSSTVQLVVRESSQRDRR